MSDIIAVDSEAEYNLFTLYGSFPVIVTIEMVKVHLSWKCFLYFKIAKNPAKKFSMLKRPPSKKLSIKFQSSDVFYYTTKIV